MWSIGKNMLPADYSNLLCTTFDKNACFKMFKR